MQELFVKICGLTRIEDALHAIECRADALGFIFDPKSEHYISPEKCAGLIDKLPHHISKVGVFHTMNLDDVLRVLKEVNLSAVQLNSGGADDLVDFKASVIKVFHANRYFDVDVMRNYLVDAFLVDTYEASEDAHKKPIHHWDKAIRAKQYGKIILSGGLTAENIESAVRFVRPYGVNVCGGVETAPGIKDKIKVREFIAKAKGVYPDEDLSDLDHLF